MAYKLISLSALLINRSNDRHGELIDESSAIAWLFNHKEKHMRNLASDIKNQGGIYEPPLVIESGGKYILADGNRRVTCLKLIKYPNRAPSTVLQKYFSNLQSDWPGKIPDKITCRVETDLDLIDEILLRRHTGSQDGVGQSPWDDRMKRNFVERTGKSKGKSVADEVEEILQDENKLPTVGKIPRSTLGRLLSSERFLNRVGLSKADKSLKFTHDKNEVLICLQKIAQDLASKKVVLGDLWNAARKDEYLDRLLSEGFLPQTPNSHQNAQEKSAEVNKKGTNKKAKTPAERKNLIPATEYQINWNSKNQRQKEIWEELQFRLEFSQHPNAIAVLLRVLLELSVKYYIENSAVSSVEKNDKLHNKIRKTAEHIFDNNKISDEYLADLKKLAQKENLISTDTLHRYVHSENFSPSPNHLKAIWDSVDEFIVQCLNS